MTRANRRMNQRDLLHEQLLRRLNARDYQPEDPLKDESISEMTVGLVLLIIIFSALLAVWFA